MQHTVEQQGLRRTVAFVVVAGVLVGLLIVASYFFYQSQQYRAQIEALRAERNALQLAQASTTERLAQVQARATRMEERLSDTQEELEDLADDYRDEKDKNEEFEDQLRDLGQTVGDLNKLAELDEELLMKYSRVSFLSENYIPQNLRQIDQDWVLDGRQDQYVIREVMPFLEDMLEDAKDDGIDLRVVSAYRSFDEQAEVKEGHEIVYGEGANQFSAEQGYSEHQLGTTVDFATPELTGPVDAFAETEAYEWLLDNAHEYGFILSYPEGNTFYIFEPWHWRFVGTELAEDLHDGDDNFYDLEQREIDKYLLDIFSD